MNNSENNILIADFMGWLIAECYVCPTNEDIEKLGLNAEFKEMSLYMLKYHSSWDWLMPVVEKIETMCFENDRYPDFFIMYDNRQGFNGWYWQITCTTSKAGVKNLYKECSTKNKRELTKIEAVYNAVIEFIEWYNKNKNNN